MNGAAKIEGDEIIIEDGGMKLNNLKKLRKSRGLSQQALAEMFNLTQQSIYKYENGLAQPDIETLIGFSTFFGTSIDYLVGAVSSDSEETQYKALHPSEREIQMLHSFRCLKPHLQDALCILIENLTI